MRKIYETLKSVKLESVTNCKHSLFMKTVTLRKEITIDEGNQEQVRYLIKIRSYQNQICEHPLATMGSTKNDIKLFRELENAEKQYKATLAYLKKKNKTDGTITFVETDKDLHSKCSMTIEEFLANLPKR